MKGNHKLQITYIANRNEKREIDIQVQLKNKTYIWTYVCPVCLLFQHRAFFFFFKKHALNYWTVKALYSWFGCNLCVCLLYMWFYLVWSHERSVALNALWLRLAVWWLPLPPCLLAACCSSFLAAPAVRSLQDNRSVQMNTNTKSHKWMYIP